MQLLLRMRLVAGGRPGNADGGTAFIEVDSAQQPDDVITSLPVWPRMDADEVFPPSSFDDRRRSAPRMLQIPEQDGLKRGPKP